MHLLRGGVGEGRGGATARQLHARGSGEEGVRRAGVLTVTRGRLAAQRLRGKFVITNVR